jgi:hypothetical protein
MYKQEANEFPEDIQKYGCYFFCLLRMCEIAAKAELTVEQVLAIYKWGKFTPDKTVGLQERMVIAQKSSVEAPDKLCAHVLTLLGSRRGILQVGGLEYGKEIFWGWANKAPYNKPEFYALKYRTFGEIGHHFVLANSDRKTLYDPSIHDYTDRPLLGGLLHKIV